MSGSNIFNLGTQNPVQASPQGSQRVRVTNLGGTNAVYFKSTRPLSTTDNDGSIAAGAFRIFTGPQWLISTATSEPLERDRTSGTLIKIEDEPTRETYNVQEFGASGDGSTLDHSQIQSAITTAHAAGGGKVVIPDGTYKCNTGLTLYSNVHIEMSGGAEIDFTGASSSATCIAAVGSEATGVSLSANASAGDTSVSVAAGAETGFGDGDYVRIRSTRKYDPGYTDTEDGEIGIVSSTSSGSITLRSPLCGANYTTANSATIAKLTMVENVRVTGGKISGLAGSTQKGVKFDKAARALVADVKVSDCPSVGVWIINCVGARVDAPHVENANNGSDGYGVNVSSTCQDCVVSNGYFRNCRHSTTVTGGDNGIARRILFTGCQGYDTISTGDCFDVHACAEDIHFRNCQSFDSGNAGFQSEAARVSIIGCTVVRPADHAITCGNSTAAATELTIIGNQIENGASVGIRIHESSLVGGGSTTNYVNIADNNISTVAGTGIYVADSSDTWRYRNVTITGNIVENSANTSSSINVQKADYVTISGNVVNNAAGAAAAIRTSDVTFASISGNVTHHAATTTGRAISVVSACSHIAISGNVGNSAASGIVLSSDSTSCTATGNDMTGCTTPYTFSTGTGHMGIGNNLTAAPSTAAAATLTLPAHTNVHTITGNTNITSITALPPGLYTLIFTGTPTLTDGNNIKIGGNFVAAGTTNDPDAFTLASDGTNFYAVGPGSAN